MKFQWAFPATNPRKKRKKTRSKKSVAKRKESGKNGSVHSKLKKAVKAMAKRRKKHRKSKATKTRKHSKRKSSRGRKRRNPVHAWLRKTVNGKSKVTAHSSTLTSPERRAHIKRDKTVAGLRKKAEAMRKAKRYDEAKALADRAHKLQSMKMENLLKDRKAFTMDVKEFQKEAAASGGKVSFTKTKEAGVAKKRKKKKKAAKKVHAKKAKPSKRRKKKSGGKKRGRKKSHKRAKHAKKHAKKASKKRSSKRGSRRRRKSRRSRMTTHTHAQSTRHVRKGSKAKFSARKRKGSYQIKTKFGKGRKKVRVSGRARIRKGVLKGFFKINPFRRNPMTDKLKAALGLDMKDVQLLAVGAAAAPLAAALAPRVPGVKQLVAFVAPYIPLKYQGAGINLVLGALCNLAADQSFTPAQARKPLSVVGEGLVAASIIQLVSSAVADGLKATGMAGINFTPSMGIMPQLNGINYTPRSMGIQPQLNGITNRGDFGAPGDYGGNAGYHQSRADFGADWSQDSEPDQSGDDSDQHSSSMN